MSLFQNRVLQSVLFALAIAAGVLGIYTLKVQLANANPQSFCYDQTAGATTTLVAMTPGTGTTTLTTTNCADGITALNGAIVQIQYTAVGTAPTLNFRVENSYNGVDWYPTVAPLQSNATTTQLTGNFADYKLIMSTSTDTGGTGTSGRVHTSFALPVDAPYVRVKFYVPTGGGNGSLWAQIVGKREMR